MPGPRSARIPVLSVGLCALMMLSGAGCGGGESQKSVDVSPEFQKKTENYLTNYQKQMFEKHKAKTGTKKR